MHERADRLTASIVTRDEGLEREFETRLVESSRLVFRVAFSVLRHRQDAEDVAQDAFARAYSRFNQLRDRARFRAWIVRLTWRLALNRQRANRRRGSREVAIETPLEAWAQGRPGPDGRGEDAAALWAAIDALPEKLRVTLVLATIEGHKVEEVAALLKVPAGTVKSRLFLARQQLKERLT
jgi:RNA polymerase sigma-70 factor, ECF subfamily